MECPDCDKNMKTLYERIGANAVFTPIGFICKKCGKVIIK